MGGEIYSGRFEARSKDGESELRGEPFGPAGVSSVELPDGTMWQVDHADLSRLVLLVVDGDLELSRLARDLLGAERFDLACAELDAQRAAKAPGKRLKAIVRETGDGWAMSAPRGSQPGLAIDIGSALLAADLSSDHSNTPLVRLAAGLEFLAKVRDGQLREVLGPVAGGVVRSVGELARGLDPDDITSLPGNALKSLHRLESLVLWAANEFPELELPLRRVDDLLRSGRRSSTRRELQGDRAAALYRLSSSRSAAEADMVEWTSADAMSGTAVPPAEPEPDYFDVRMPEAGRVVVTTGRQHQDMWISVKRLAGLVPLALVPLLPKELTLEAVAVVPPELALDELAVTPVAPDELVGPERPFELVRAAVESGRAAARYERLVKMDAAAEAWIECARLWAAAGDHGRAELAQERVGYGRNWNVYGTVRALVADELFFDESEF